jgi:hypothetical protein
MTVQAPQAPRRLALAGLALAVALAGCGSGGDLSTPGAHASGGGMDMGGSSGSMSVDGIKPVPTQRLASATWQGMKITAQATTPVPFVVYDGTHERTVKPPKGASFHLMVMLDDAHTHVPIPYATVWATIRKASKIVYDERQWPMLSAYMGPHYGNDVSLPGSGSYRLSLLISPPVSARHVEYRHVWLKPHRVNLTFHWAPRS